VRRSFKAELVPYQAPGTALVAPQRRQDPAVRIRISRPGGRR